MLLVCYCAKPPDTAGHGTANRQLDRPTHCLDRPKANWQKLLALTILRTYIDFISLARLPGMMEPATTTCRPSPQSRLRMPQPQWLRPRKYASPQKRWRVCWSARRRSRHGRLCTKRRQAASVRQDACCPSVDLVSQTTSRCRAR